MTYTTWDDSQFEKSSILNVCCVIGCINLSRTGITCVHTEHRPHWYWPLYLDKNFQSVSADGTSMFFKLTFRLCATVIVVSSNPGNVCMRCHSFFKILVTCLEWTEYSNGQTIPTSFFSRCWSNTSRGVSLALQYACSMYCAGYFLAMNLFLITPACVSKSCRVVQVLLALKNCPAQKEQQILQSWAGNTRSKSVGDTSAFIGIPNAFRQDCLPQGVM